MKYQSITFYQTKWIVLASFILGIFLCVYVAYKEYHRLTDEFETSVTEIITSIENSATNAVYTYNKQLAEEIANGLAKFDPIIEIELVDDFGESMVNLKKPPHHTTFLNSIFNPITPFLSTDNLHKKIKLHHLEKGQLPHFVGNLNLVISKAHMYDRFLSGLYDLILSAIVLTSLLAIFLIILFQKVLANPLIKISNSFSQFDMEHPERTLLPEPEDFPNNEFRTVVINGRKLLEKIIENVSELKHSHDELEQRVERRTEDLQRLTQAVEQSPTMVFITDQSATIEYANTKFYEFTGYTEKEVIGQNPKILSSENTSEKVHQTLWKTVQSGKIWKHQIEDIRKDGTPYWADITIAPLRDKHNQITHYVCTQEDITERIQTLEELTSARDEAEKANRSKSEFLSNMSHELRTPLNAILGFAQLMENSRKHPLAEKQRVQVGQIVKGGKHLLELINEILELSKIEAGKLDLSVESVDAKELINDCLALSSTIAKDKNITIKDCTKWPQPKLKADRLRTKQVLMNLISNSIKYNREGGHVWIYGKVTQSSTFHISIVDTGVGIPEDKHDELFKPFNRLGAETSGVEGTGIGLALSKRLVELMGGSIGVVSFKDKSTTFWCEIPINDKDECFSFNSKTTFDENDAINIHKKEERVLLYVEDNDTNLALFEDVIEDIDNVSMISTHLAELGIEMAKSEQPDIIILDINLPGMDGIEACRRLKKSEKTRHIPVIALSANAMPENVSQAMENGFEEYLTKPLNIPQLFNVLEKYL